MTTWLAGMEVTADRLNAGLTPTATSTGLTAKTNFTVSAFSGYKVGPMAFVFATITTTNQLTQTSGNLSDVDIATLPDGWEPRDTVNGCFGNGLADGEYTISTSGTITLRSAVANIGAGTGLRLSSVYVYAT